MTGWGFKLQKQHQTLQWAKLLLLNDKDRQEYLKETPSQVSQANAYLEKRGLTAVKAIADYLKDLWAHILECITKKLMKMVVDRTPFRIVMTVPAIWKPYACDNMLEAAKLAGMLNDRPCGATTITFTSEPEAAARATLMDISHRNDVFVRLQIYLVYAPTAKANLGRSRKTISLPLSTAVAAPW
jgi:hypothetical protein